VLPFGRELAFGAYLVEPHELALVADLPEDRRVAFGSNLRESGGAIGWHCRERLRLGLRLSVGRLQLRSEQGPKGEEVVSSNSDDALGAQAGLLWRAGRRIVLGSSFRFGYRWEHESPAGLSDQRVELSAPHVVSLAGVYRLPIGDGRAYAFLSSQFDYVWLATLADGYRTLAGGDGRIGPDDGLEYRLGAEVNLPVSAQYLQLRCGLHRQSPRAPSEPAEPDGRVAFSAGASLLTSPGLRLHASMSWGERGERRVFTLNAAFRFAP
jgi:hypothetical protein